ncbi:MAG TPA: serine hydrolase domain-containing protein [Longimicrobium sp.]
MNPPAIQVDPPPPLLVGSGNLPPELAPFDSAVRAYMKKYQISAGVLAVAKDKKIVLSRGYGWLGPTFSEAVQPDTPMRIASVVKPITRAAIRKLVKDGKLALQDKAFGDSLLGSKRLNRPGHAVDPRLTDITIQHLIDHKGGWDRYQAPLFDPMMQTTLISMATGRQPAGANDVIRFMIGQPLQRDPGTKEIYSNFGYCVLGRIIEKVSGKKYIDYLRDDLLGALDITSVEVSRSLPTDRNRREPVYVSREPPVPNVMMPATPPVPACDGGLHLEAMDSHGGLIVSAPDLVRFAAKFNNDGTPYDDEPAGTAHEGSLPGTTARLQWRMDNVLIAAIFNLRHPPEGRKFDPDKFNPEALSPNAAEIGAALNKAADSITRWP